MISGVRVEEIEDALMRARRPAGQRPVGDPFLDKLASETRAGLTFRRYVRRMTALLASVGETLQGIAALAIES